MVGPAEVTPDHVVVDLAQRVADAQNSADAQNGDAELQTVDVGLLIELQPVGQGQTGGTEGCVTGGDGAGNDAQHGQHQTHRAHGFGADVIDGRGAAATHFQQLGALIDGAAGSGPNQCDDALADHGAVEHHVTLTLGFHAPGHQRRLRGVEAGDGAAGHSDEHEGPNGGPIGMHVGKVVPDFRDHIVGIGEHTKAHAHGHDDQADAEEGIDLADDLIDGNKGCDEIVDQDQNQPKQLVGQNVGETGVGEQQLDQTGGTNGKHGAHHDQQHHAEHTHDVLHAVAKIDAGDLGNRSAVVALRQHAGEIVVYAAGEDGAEGDPQKNDGSPQSASQSTEDGTQTGNVQKLNQKQLPLGHDDVIDAVVDADSGSLPVVWGKRVVNDFAVCKVTDNQNRQTDEKTDHRYASLEICADCTRQDNRSL